MDEYKQVYGFPSYGDALLPRDSSSFLLNLGYAWHFLWRPLRPGGEGAVRAKDRPSARSRSSTALAHAICSHSGTTKAIGSIVTRSLPFALAARHFPTTEVNILHTQGHTFHQTHAGAVQQSCHQCMRAFHFRKDCRDFLFGQHRRQPRRPVGTVDVVEPGEVALQHLLVQEERGAQRLLVGRHADMAFIGQVGQEGLDLGRSHVPRMPQTMEADIPPDPVDISLLCP